MRRWLRRMMATERVVDTPDYQGPTLTQAQLEDAIRVHRRAAGREFPKVEQFTTDPPTPWTLKHRIINRLLTEWERAPH